MFKKMIMRIALRQARRAAKKEAGVYDVAATVEKGAPAALLALLVPLIVKLLKQLGIEVSNEDALQLALWILAGGSVLSNWFKHWLLPKIAKR